MVNWSGPLNRKWNMRNVSMWHWPTMEVLFSQVKITASMSIATWWHHPNRHREEEEQPFLEIIHLLHRPYRHRQRHPMGVRWLELSAYHPRSSMVTMKVHWPFQHPWQVTVIRDEEEAKAVFPCSLVLLLFSRWSLVYTCPWSPSLAE